MAGMRRLAIVLPVLFANALFAQSNPSERYENPVDGRTYIAPGGWQAYQPKGGRTPAQGKIRLDNVRLLSSQSEFGSNVGNEALIEYIRLIEKQAAEVFGQSKAGVVLIQVNSAPEHQEIQLAFQGDVDELLIARFHDRLVKLGPLKVKNSPVAFQVQISIAP